jgi:glycosyltransferase involved in cell wall biosynthesis
MACGCPVIASNTSSLPEVIGDAGIMFDPYNVDQLSSIMYEILTNSYLKDDLIKKGLRRAKMFNWKRCAEETMEVYYSIASNR